MVNTGLFVGCPYTVACEVTLSDHVGAAFSISFVNFPAKKVFDVFDIEEIPAAFSVKFVQPEKELILFSVENSVVPVVVYPGASDLVPDTIFTPRSPKPVDVSTATNESDAADIVPSSGITLVSHADMDLPSSLYVLLLDPDVIVTNSNVAPPYP
jgi:hypothetical protein